MTRPLAPLALVAALLVVPAAAPPGTRPPALGDLEGRVRAALRPVRPDAKFAYEDEGTTLAVEYHCQAFLVHPVYHTGEIGPKALKERGPNHDGFRLTLDFREGPLVSMAVLPQDFPGPYWTTSRSAVEWSEGGKPRHVLVGLSYGRHTDKGVLEAVKAAVKEFAESRPS